MEPWNLLLSYWWKQALNLNIYLSLASGNIIYYVVNSLRILSNTFHGYLPLSLSAPNIYSMPPVLGEAKEGGKRAAPAFSIAGRGKTAESRTPMPGPGTYTTDRAEAALGRRPPAFTMAPRREIKSTTAIPGPGAHCPEKVRIRCWFLFVVKVKLQC